MIGTREWLTQTHGALSPSDRRAHAADAVRVLMADMPGRLRFMTGAGSGPELGSDTAVPPTALASAALAWVEETHEPWLLAHCLRTWAFARLFAEVERLEVDDETLFLACLMHDIALTDGDRIPDGEGCGCFAMHGAHLAEAKLLELGASPGQAAEVADAIGLHLNASVPTSIGASSHLLSSGVGVDVIGIRASELGRAAVARVIEKHDRDGFRERVTAALRDEAVRRPKSRAASLFRVGFALAIRFNPIDRISTEG